MYYIFADFEDKTMTNYTIQLKKRYKSKCVPKNRWPPFTPKKFTDLGYIIHKPKRTAQETERSAKLARSGNHSSKKLMHLCDTFDSNDNFDTNDINEDSKKSIHKCDTNVIIEEEISNIFLPTSKQPQVILIEGAPGIGKTMLMNEIGYRWAIDEILKDKIVLLFFSLRDPKVNEMKSIPDMFLKSYENKKEAEIYAKYFICNNGQGLVILLDGLDENPQTIQSGTFLHDVLIEQKMFTEACIVITSRPHATIEIQQDVSYRVEIIGFTDKRRQEFVQENLKGKANDLNNYLQTHEIIDTLCYIPLNMTIVLFLFRGKYGLKELPKTQTELTKQAVRMTVLRYLQNLKITETKMDLENLPKPYDDLFYYLSALAYNALAKGKLTFTDDEIWKACPVVLTNNDKRDTTVNGLDLIQRAQFFRDGDGDIESLSNFAHYSVQELLAAWYIAFSHRSCFQQLPLKWNIQNCIQCCSQYFFQLRKLQTNFWNGDYMNMWSFYIGLTGGKDLAFQHFVSSNMFRSYVQCKTFYRPKEFLSNIKWLRLYMLQEPTSYEIVEHMDVLQCIVSKNLTKIKTIALYFMLQEARDNEIITDLDAVVAKNRLDLSEESLVSNQDLNLLGYILSRPYLTKQWESVNLSYCEIDDEKFEVLQEILTKNDGRPKPEIKDLQLSGNKLKSCGDAIANVVCCQKVSQLNLSKNILEDITSFERCGDFLETLDASYNKLDGEKASESLTALKFLRKLKVLKLNHNDIKDDEDVNDAIGLALCSCNSLEVLKLDGNFGEFENKATLLFTVINEVRNSKSDEHCYNGQSDKASAFLKILDHCDQMDYQPDSCALRNKLIQCKILDISYNGLENDAGRCLGRCLHLFVNLKTLNIAKNNLSDDATKKLTMGMLLTTNLKKFEYADNLFNEHSTAVFRMIRQLRTAPNKYIFKCAPLEIKALVFILKCASEMNEEEQQSSDIISTITYIEELVCSHDGAKQAYKITSTDLIELCTTLPWFKQLKILDVRNNSVTDEAKESLALVMLQIHTLNTLKLTGNPIFNDEHSMAVFDTIKKVREKQVKSIIVADQQSSSDTKCQSIIYIMKCLNYLENPNCSKLFNTITTLNVDSKLGCVSKFFEYLNFLPFLCSFKVNNVTCITDHGMNKLCNYISQSKALITLDLSFCNLENLKIESKPNSINSLQTVKLNYGNISCEVLYKLSLNMIVFTNLNRLEIEGNSFGDKGISDLHNVLLNSKNDQLSITITAVSLANNQLTSRSSVKIIEIVQKCKVKYLNISDNCLENFLPCFEKFTITTLEELNISANNRQTHNATQFAKNISYLKSCSSLKKLNISNNSIDETAIDEIYYSFMECVHLEEVTCNGNPAENEIEVAFYFVKNLYTDTCSKNIFKCPPSKIKALVYLLRCLNDNEEKLQSSDMVSRLGLVTELNLSHNDSSTLEYKLTSEDLRELCKVLTGLNQLEVLDVRNNDITNEAKESLVRLMLQINTLNSVKLIGNPIFDDNFSMSVFDTIKNLRDAEKQLQSIIYNQRSPSHVEYHSVIYILECLSKVDNPNCFKSFDNIVTLDIESESDYAGKFFEYLNYLSCLKILKINKVGYITDYGMKQLSNYLSHNKLVTTLDLSFCNLQNLDIENEPSGYIPLKVLKFNHSNITEKVLFKLSHMLKFANLDELDLGGNFFGDKGVSNLHNVLLDCENDQLSIVTLNLANNQLTSSSAVKIIEIVQKCRVKYLDISHNYLGSIFVSFKNFIITTLEELNISTNNYQTHNAVQFAENISYLKSCSSLKKLNISNNSIDETAIDEIYYSFMECVHLKEIICNGNSAEKDIKEAFDFVQSLYQQKQSCVERINFKELRKATLAFISKISLLHSDVTVSLVTSAEIQVQQVRSIDFSHNELRIDKNFTCVLQNCTQLEFLNLEKNDITTETFKHLAAGFLFTSKLMISNLHLNGNPCIINPKNKSVLQMIESLRLDIYHFVCTPAKFESFLTILELVDGVSSKPKDIAKTISLIKTLDLSSSELTNSLNQHTTKLQSDDIKIFCNYLNYFESLESINMTSNNIKEDAKDDLAIAVLRNYRVTEIHLEGNPIHKITTCHKLFETIGKLRRCRYAYPFKDIPRKLEALVNILQYVKDFADKTCDITNNIEHLDISSFYQPHYNTRYGIEKKIDHPEKISTGLIYHLTLFRRLKTLNLHNAYLTLDSIQELSKFLCNNNTLLHLDISNNDIQAEGALIIVKSLIDTNTTLKKLNLSNNKILGEKRKEVNRIIDRLSRVKVDMSGNEPTKASKRTRLKWPSASN